MNYIILIGIALFFLVSAIHDGAMGWDFGEGRMDFRIVNGDYTLRVRADGDGDVDLAPDGSGVTALPDGGSFDVRLARNGTDRRVLFSSPAGTIERQFFVNGEEQPWGPEADRFVTEVMPIVLRETAINHEARVAWLIANRGQDGVLAEIELIHSDFAQRVYSVEYARAAVIEPADFDRLMRTTANMGSDFDLRTALSEIHDEEMPTGEQFVALLGAGATLGSDFDARTLLEHVGPRMPNTPEAVTAYLNLADTIGSDFDLRLALTPIVANVELGDELVARAIDVASGQIGSDFDLFTLLGEAAPRVGASETLARAYTSAASSIGGDFELRGALTALAERADLTAGGWVALLDSAQSLGGDFDCAELLTTVAPKLPDDAAVIAAYRAAMRTIGSDFDQGRAAAALVRAGF
jgi:hypothetical protein